MQKRGQVTIFVILGIILVAAIIVGIVLRKDIVSAVSRSETTTAASFQEQAEEVKAHVEECLTDALKEAVFHSIIGSSTSLTQEMYYEQVSLFIKDQLNACIDFTLFPNLYITRGGQTEVRVYGDSKEPPTKIQADLKMRVDITRGEDHASFDELTGTIPLKSRAELAQ
ncbi:MAG TPA: hypothetical protein HA362_07475 [Nanoarchaeota archaeon]|nr:hypothetical protein [Nanoarchaeota archaeon]